MKILQVINHLDKGGGAEQFVHDIILSYLKEGHQVTILNISRSPNNQLLDSVYAVGAECLTLGEKRFSLSSFFRLKKVIKSGNYDVVHVHLFPALYYCAFAKLLFRIKTPLVYTEHSTKNRRRGSLFFKKIDGIAYRQYNKVVCITEKVKEALCEHLSFLSPVVVNNGVNVEKIKQTHPTDVRKMLNISETSKLLVMIGRFVEGKDYETVFDAMKILDDKYHFLCIGDGPKKDICMEKVKGMGIEDRVHFLGLRTDVIELVKGCDIAILSTEHEGFSISMLEVMACSKPFIASSVPGIVDLVSDYALLFPYKDSGSLKKQIEKCANDSLCYEDYANRSNAFATNYDIKNTAHSYLDLYQSLL